MTDAETNSGGFFCLFGGFCLLWLFFSEKKKTQEIFRQNKFKVLRNTLFNEVFLGIL